MQYSYVLVTPARNEEDYIEGVIESVASQSILPRKWIIVSDGSTDRTEEIVLSYARNRDYIQLIRMAEHRGRNFAAKVECFEAGRDLLKGVDYDIIANLDADITFGPDYFEYLLARFAENPRLGVAGTAFVENGGHYDYRFTNIEHVSGQCQLFRRKCFEDIGGYTPIKGGGIDWVAVTTARMRGWETRTFTGRSFFHHRTMGSGNSSGLLVHFKQGQKDYSCGNHPLWEVFRALYQFGGKPYVIRGLLIMSGYVWSLVRIAKRPIPEELLQFIRAEQLRRLRQKFSSPAGRIS
ncbi:MAG: glycosyltransferase family A protein [Syntrophobacteraceae bacterium]|nr:glycosyltransferase family A protein [Syntrophobacteraceae bacterium]